MATLKICTHDRTHWITNVREITLVRTFEVKNFEHPIMESGEADAIVRQQGVDPAYIADFQGPDSERGIEGDLWGVALHVTFEGDTTTSVRVVAPERSCFLMSDQGATVDRI